MKTKELQELIDGCTFDVEPNDCYIAIAKVGTDASISFEGNSDMLEKTLVSLMRKFPDFGDIVCNAAEAYNLDFY